MHVGNFDTSTVMVFVVSFMVELVRQVAPTSVHCDLSKVLNKISFCYKQIFAIITLYY